MQAASEFSRADDASPHARGQSNMSPMTTNHIAAAREGAVQRIQLNRPKKNAITIEMYAALADASAAADADRLVVPLMLLHGASDAFCAGNDWGRCIPPRLTTFSISCVRPSRRSVKRRSLPAFPRASCTQPRRRSGVHDEAYVNPSTVP